MLPVPRLLHRAGAEVDFLGPPDAWARRSSFVSRWIPTASGAEFVVRSLEGHLRTHRYDWVVIGDDLLLAALRAHADEAWVHAILPVPADPVRLDLLGSKLGFVRAATALDLPIPESRVCQGLDELERGLRELGGVAMIKEEGLSGGDGCQLVQNVARLSELDARVLNRPVVLQRYLPGPVYSVEGLYDRGRLCSVLTSEVMTTWSGPFSPSAVRRFFHHDGLVALAQEIGRKVSLHGFSNISMLEDPRSRQPRLIELDPRPNLMFHLGDTLGVGMVEALRGLLAQSEVGPLRQLPPDRETLVPIFPNDLLRCFNEKDWRGIGAWMRNEGGRWRFIPNGDPRMSLALARFVLRRLVRSILLSSEVRRGRATVRAIQDRMKRTRLGTELRRAVARAQQLVSSIGQ